MSDPAAESNDSIQNAYASPPVSARYGGPPIRPLGITVTMVLCLLFGVLGFFNSLLGAVGLFFSDFFQGMASASGDPSQAQMQAELQAVAERFMIPNILLLVAAAALSIALIVGGVGLILTKPWSRPLLRRTFMAAILLEVARGIFGVIAQTQNLPIMEKYFAEAAPGGQGFAQMTTVFMWAGLAFWLLWAVTKIGVLIWGRVYLASQRVEDYFAAVNPPTRV